MPSEYKLHFKTRSSLTDSPTWATIHRILCRKTCHVFQLCCDPANTEHAPRENPVSVPAKDGEVFVKEIQSNRTTDPHIGTGQQETRSQFSIMQRKRTCRKLVHLGHVEIRHFRKKVE